MSVIRRWIFHSSMAILYLAMLSSCIDSDPSSQEKTYYSSSFTEDNIANSIVSMVPAAKNNALADVAAGMAAGQIESKLENWVDQFGTAKVDLRVNRDFSLKDSSLDLLFPIMNREDNILFTQLGMRDHNRRFTTNLGLGYRYFTDNWMLGHNVFYDATWNKVNQRYGLGLEAWRDNLKLSANSYFRITDWHDSLQHSDYDERPANGWDIGAEGWLPVYPHLGAKMYYEQYYGQEVILSGLSRRQHNPHAVTVGLNWTPVPLFTVGVEHKDGKSGVNDTQFLFSLRYIPGQPWQKLISADAVSEMRKLTGSRLDLVNRNNPVVMDYRQQVVINLGFPAQLNGVELTEISFTPVISSRYGVARIELNDQALVKAGGRVLEATPAIIRLQLPEGSSQPVRLSGVAYDRNGNRSNVANTMLTSELTPHKLAINPDKPTAVADGREAVTVTVELTTANGQPLVGQKLALTTDIGQLSALYGETDSNGKLQVSLTSLKAGVSHVTAIAGNLRETAEVTFTEKLDADLTADKPTAVANGHDLVQFHLQLLNAAGSVVSGEKVHWSTTLGSLSASDTLTDAQGQTTISLSSTLAGTAAVTAQYGGSQTSTRQVNFTGQVLAPVLVITPGKTQADADGTDSIRYVVTVSRPERKPIVGETVQWATNLGQLSAQSSVTDDKGQASVMLTSNQPGKAILTATVSNTVKQAEPVNFTVFANNLDLVADKPEVPAGQIVTLKATVKDSTGALMSGQQVNWTTSAGNLSALSSTTNGNGETTVTLSSDTDLTANVVASSGSRASAILSITFTEAPLVVSAAAVDKDGGNANGVVFGDKSPVYLWPRAQLRLTVTGALSPVIWQSPDPAVTVAGDVITVVGKPSKRPLTLTASNNQKQSATYTLNFGKWIYVSPIKRFWSQVPSDCTKNGGSLMSQDVMHSVYTEWGNLFAYVPWRPAEFYFTSTPFTGTGPATENNSTAFWAEDGSGVKNNWSSLYFACM